MVDAAADQDWWSSAPLAGAPVAGAPVPANVPRITVTPSTPTSGAPAPSDDDWWKSAPVAPFADRFAAAQPRSDLEKLIAGPAGAATAADTAALSKGLRRAADEKIAAPDAGGQTKTFIENAVNTALLNVPRNIDAYARSRESGRPFSEEYQGLKDTEEAGNRLNPKSALAGTATGIVAGAATLPGIGGGATLAARAGRAALTGAGYGAVAEAFDSKDPVHVAVSAALGGALGGIAAPIAEKIVGLVSGLLKSGQTANAFLKPDGTLTEEAVAAARGAGIDPATFNDVLSRKYAETFGKKGASPATAKEAAADEFGVKLTPGEATGNYGVIAREQSMAADAHGPVAGKNARDFYDAREGQIDRAKTGIQERTAEQQPLVSSVNEASNIAGAGTRQAAARDKAGYKGAYDDALSREGEFSDAAFHDIGERIRREALKGESPVVINDRTTPVAASAIQHLDENIGKLRIQDRAEPRSMEARTAGEVKFPGEPARVPGAKADDSHLVGVNMRGVEQARKELVSFYKSAKAGGNAEDIRAVRKIIAGFDDELETAIATGLFKGDENALPALKRARALFSEYQKTFRSQGPGDAVGKSIEKIVERDASGGDIANLLYGKAAIGERGDAVKLAGKLKQILGPNSEEWSAVRQGLWLRLTSKPEGMTDYGPQALAERIFRFTNGDGADMARAMFTPKEIGEMRRFGTVMKSIVPPKGTVNYSNSAWTLMRELGLSGLIGGGSFWLTNDPVTSAGLASLKIGGRITGDIVRGFKAARHFAAGAPSTPAAVAAGRSRGPAAGLTGARLDDQVIDDGDRRKSGASR